MGRTDDLISRGPPALHGRMEEVLSSQPDVAECAVFGWRQLTGEVPCRLRRAQGRRQQAAGGVGEGAGGAGARQIGPVAAFKPPSTVSRLPKTRSGKIARHDEEDRRRRRMVHAGHDRRSRHPRGDRRGIEGPPLSPWPARDKPRALRQAAPAAGRQVHGTGENDGVAGPCPAGISRRGRTWGIRPERPVRHSLVRQRGL